MLSFLFPRQILICVFSKPALFFCDGQWSETQAALKDHAGNVNRPGGWGTREAGTVSMCDMLLLNNSNLT